MSEMRRMACPSCSAENHPLGVVDGIKQYRCRDCGIVYYGPCGCDTVHDEPAPAASAVESPLRDFEMSRPYVQAYGASAVKPYAGCS